MANIVHAWCLHCSRMVCTTNLSSPCAIASIKLGKKRKIESLREIINIIINGNKTTYKKTKPITFREKLPAGSKDFIIPAGTRNTGVKNGRANIITPIVPRYSEVSSLKIRDKIAKQSPTTQKETATISVFFISFYFYVNVQFKLCDNYNIFK